MTGNSDCKGCRASVRLKAGEVERLLAEYLRAHPQELAPDPLRAQRLALCRACPDLQYGSTCAHCGCLVDLRAALAGQHCPRPAAARW